jgi:hypothetical protein
MDCIDPEGPSHEYVCSIAGCGDQPVILAVLDNEGAGSALVCKGHFSDIKGSVISYMELPQWLTEGKAFLTGEGDVVFHFDIGPDGD